MSNIYNDQETFRREHLAKLKSQNADPFAKTKFDVQLKSTMFKAKFAHLEPGTSSNEEMKMAGRIIGKRQTFLVVLDDQGQFQTYVSKKENPETFALVESFDIGDIVGFTGHPMKTRTGEVTLALKTCEMLSKSLRVLPEK
jgi:lysyl-tRNA synthetase class 2